MFFNIISRLEVWKSLSNVRRASFSTSTSTTTSTSNIILSSIGPHVIDEIEDMTHLQPHLRHEKDTEKVLGVLSEPDESDFCYGPMCIIGGGMASLTKEENQEEFPSLPLTASPFTASRGESQNYFQAAGNNNNASEAYDMDHVVRKATQEAVKEALKNFCLLMMEVDGVDHLCMGIGNTSVHYYSELIPRITIIFI